VPPPEGIREEDPMANAGGRDRLRNAMEPQRHLGDDAERALRADEEPIEATGPGLTGKKRPVCRR
jgi:hypothetical protein